MYPESMIDGRRNPCAIWIASICDLARDEIARLSPRPSPAPAPKPATPTPPPPPAVTRTDDPAIRDLDKKIQTNPSDAVAYYKRGQLYAQYGDFRQATRDFDEVIEPAKTHQILAETLAAAPAGRGAHGNIPL